VCNVRRQRLPNLEAVISWVKCNFLYTQKRVTNFKCQYYFIILRTFPLPFIYKIKMCRSIFKIVLFLCLSDIISAQQPIADTITIKKLLRLGKDVENVNIDSAKSYYEQAFKLSQKINNRKFLATSKMRIAFLPYIQGDLYKAIEYLEQSRDFAKKINVPDIKISSDINIAICYDNLGRYSDSYEMFRKIFTEADSLKKGKFKSMVAVNMSKSMISMKRWSEGVHLAKSTIALTTEQNDVMGRSITYNNLAICQRELNQFKEAIQSLKLAYADANALGIKQEQERYFSSMCGVFLKQGKLDSALIYGLDAVAISSKNKNDFNLLVAKGQLSEVYFSLKKYSLAEKEANSYLDISRKHQIAEDIVKAYALKYKIAKATNNVPHIKSFADSLLYYQSYLSKINQDKEIAYTEGRFKLDLLRKDLAIQSSLLEVEKTKRKYLWMGFGLFSLLASVLIFSFTKRRRDSLKLNLEKSFGNLLVEEIDAYRKEIASTLHDDIGQHLLFVKQNIKKIVGDKHEAITSFDSILETIRGLSRQNFPHQIEYIGLSSALTELYDWVESRSNISIIDEYLLLDNLIQKDYALHIYKIIQELISNSIKHSNSKTIWISLKEENDELLIIYKENNSTAQLKIDLINKPKSLGWKIIQHRLDILKGSFAFESTADSQTIVFHVKKYKSNGVGK
jgi:signal transduction histidine kinase